MSEDPGEDGIDTDQTGNRTRRSARRLRGTNEKLTEAKRFFRPITRIASFFAHHLHWVWCLLFLAYSLSGITFVQANEVGLVLRMGRLVGRNSADAIHKPGVLFALPRPFDKVIRIRTESIKKLRVIGPHVAKFEDSQEADAGSRSMDGYLLTADRNLVHARIAVRYKIADPIAFTLHVVEPTEMLRSAVLQAVIKSAGSTKLDELFGAERNQILRNAAANAQDRLEKTGVGLELVSIEVDDLSPPHEVIEDFDAVQSANISARTLAEQANEYAAKTLPAAHTKSKARITKAQAYAEANTSHACSHAKAFEEMLVAYQADKSVVRARLYREGVDRVLHRAEDVTFFPAPRDATYDGIRLEISLRDSHETTGSRDLLGTKE